VRQPQAQTHSGIFPKADRTKKKGRDRTSKAEAVEVRRVPSNQTRVETLAAGRAAEEGRNPTEKKRCRSASVKLPKPTRRTAKKTSKVERRTGW